LGIECKLKLSFRKRLFAGVSVYRGAENEIKTVTCGELDGVVAYGDVTETGLPENASEAKAA
jgi:hypothetical protein